MKLFSKNREKSFFFDINHFHKNRMKTGFDKFLFYNKMVSSYFWAVFSILTLYQNTYLISGFPDTTTLTTLTTTNNINNSYGLTNTSCLYQPWFCQLLQVFTYERINQVKTIRYIA